MIKRVLILSLLIGCSSRPDVAPGSLSITPDPISFRQLEREETEIVQTVFIKNKSGGVLEISTVGLTELDETKELTIQNAEELSNAVLSPNEERSVQVVWRPSDLIRDEGRLEIGIVGQLPVAVPIQSPEVPAFVKVSTTPEGVAGAEDYQLTLNGAPIGGRQAAWVNIEATSLAGLTLRRLCFLDESGGCQLETESGFALCAGRVTSPQDCSGPELPVQMAQSDRIQTTLFFTPPTDSDQVFFAQILVDSNDRDAPSFLVNVSATVCRSEMGSETCGSCGNRSIDPGEECDDGNRNDTDECKNDCLLPTCSDPPDSDGDGLADRCDERPNIPDFSSKARVRFVGGRNLGDQHTQMGGASTGRVQSNNEEFKHRARVVQ